MPRRFTVLSLLLLALSPAGPAFALGGTELEHVARRLATELGTTVRPADFEAPSPGGFGSPFGDGRVAAQAWLLGPEGSEGLLLLSTAGMGHAYEPAEVPGQGGELLRLPQLVVGVRRLGGGLEPRCGAAVFEMQLDPKTRVPHASGLRTLVWADLAEFPHACGALRRYAPLAEGLDGLVFELPARDRRTPGAQPALFREQARVRLAPGVFLPLGEPDREPIESLRAGEPLLVEYEGVDERRIVELEHDDAAGSALVQEISGRLPEVRVIESDSGWGWTRVQLEGPRAQVDRFLSELQQDGRSGQLNAELVLRSGELARATIRFRPRPAQDP